MSAPICRGCGAEKTRTAPSATMQWICRPCLRVKLRERSRKPIGVEPVSCEGAGERLQRLLEKRWDEIAPRLADLLEGRPRDVDGRRESNAARATGKTMTMAKGAA